VTLPFVNNPEFHGTVNVAASVKFGRDCTVWQYATICDDVVLGDNVVVGSCVWIGSGTVVGAGTRIQHGAFITKDSLIGECVFIGPNATLTDDKYPKAGEPYSPQPPHLEDGCSIGAGAVVLPGVRVGSHAMVGAGAVAVDNVRAHTTVGGVPARQFVVQG
jgi:acetyltransferase-like isoleucine patch superfamily enzyme